MKYYLLAFKRAFDFKGKSSQKEFWVFFLLDCLIYILIGFFEGATSYIDLSNNIMIIYSILTFIPFISLGFRRLNDAGYNKLLFLIPIANLFFASMETKD
ncbi:DUF805 domain-containing protein [Polaribacter sp. HL-MS24]|uniref:DUF805 domain-containing protein n=1 Tax=Polaribacter sp. HL-MS24 TaxID=3077735 RepID=UPI00293487F5|nr:DUF805 domain-containing protein [Polaribacter sp. HL-MS24]WOC40387.1 DUF805 domain-containing protein [Polaribacter sp. HL-MS24]